MPTFTYKAKKGTGETVSGSLAADSERGVLDALDRLKLFPLELRQATAAEIGATVPQKRHGAGAMAAFGRKTSSNDVCNFTRQLSDLLGAGVPLNQALISLAAQTTKPALVDVIEKLREDVSAGTSFSEAMTHHPKVFSPLHISMVKAGETGGFLEDVLERISVFLEREEELRNRVKSAMAYPVLLMVVGTCAVVFLLTFFIPKFAVIFNDLGGTLPLPTRILLAVSGFLQGYGLFLAAGLVAAFFLLKRYTATADGRLWWDKFKLAMPVVGTIGQRSAISRFSRTFGTLLKSGVPVLQALEISKEALANLAMANEIEKVRESVKEGKSIAQPLRGSACFPPTVVDMLAVGEEAGNLEEILLRIAQRYDSEVDRAVKLFVSLLEPMMILVMAGIVGFVVISMLLPVFTLNSMIK
jgi:type II secretion system protein F